MLYLLEVIEDKYKIYDSESKEISVKDVDFLDSNEILGVVDKDICQPFTKRELQLASYLELISDDIFKHYGKTRFPVFWTADLSTWICYDNTGKEDYKNLISLICYIFCNYPNAYEIDGEYLKIYLFEHMLVFRIKNKDKFELLKTKIVCLIKKENI